MVQLPEEFFVDKDNRKIIVIGSKFTVLEMVNAVLDLCEEREMVENVVFCGWNLEDIILSNAIAINQLYPGLTVTVAIDAVTAQKYKKGKRALKVLKDLGIKICTTAEITGAAD